MLTVEQHSYCSMVFFIYEDIAHQSLPYIVGLQSSLGAPSFRTCVTSKLAWKFSGHLEAVLGLARWSR